MVCNRSFCSGDCPKAGKEPLQYFPGAQTQPGGWCLSLHSGAQSGRRAQTQLTQKIHSQNPSGACGLCSGQTRPGLVAAAIAGRLQREIAKGTRPAGEYLNHESIYQYIYDEAQHPLRLWEKLPRRHKKRRRWLGRKSQTIKIPHRTSIRSRPEAVSLREGFGHWEGDTIVGNRHRTGVHTEVERVSRFVFACRIPASGLRRPGLHSWRSLPPCRNRRASPQPWTMALRTTCT
jgi:hypothetical protein